MTDDRIEFMHINDERLFAGSDFMSARPPFLQRIDSQVQWGRPGVARMPDGSYLASMDADEPEEYDDIGWGVLELILPIALLGVIYAIWHFAQ